MAIAEYQEPAADYPVFLASGTNFPDGLTVAPLASREQGPVLLTDGADLGAATAAYLAGFDPTGARTTAVGGAAAAAAPHAARKIVGADQYETSALVAKEFTGRQEVFGIGLALGGNWPDALVGAATMGRIGGPLILTDGTTLSPGNLAAARAITTAHGSNTRSGLVFGGKAAVGTRPLQQLDSIITGTAVVPASAPMCPGLGGCYGLPFYFEELTQYEIDLHSGAPDTKGRALAHRGEHEREAEGDCRYGEIHYGLKDPRRGLDPGQSLNSGEWLLSLDRSYGSTLQADGNLVAYGANYRPLWSSGTSGNPGARLTLQHDGDAVLHSADNTVLWHSSTQGNPGAVLRLRGDGNVVIVHGNQYNKTVRFFTGWDRTGLDPGEILYQGQQVTSPNGRYHLILEADGELATYGPGGRPIFLSGSIGATTVRLLPDGNLVAYKADGSPAFDTGTNGAGRVRLEVLDDGKVVLYDADRRPVWSSGA